MTPIQILIVDDHSIVRQGIRSLLSNYLDLIVAGEAASVAAALEWLNTGTPDVILLDIRMPDGSGLSLLRSLRTTLPMVKVLILTSFDDDDYVLEAMRHGAAGYVLKGASDEMLVNAIRAVMQGETVLSSQVTEQIVQRLLKESPPVATHSASLTPEELSILRLLVGGASNLEMGERLAYSTATIKRKLRRIFDKLTVESRTEAAVEAIRRGLA